MNATEPRSAFTGRHMLAIMIAFFGTIIIANGLMAYFADSSWSGILAKNTYVASQDFNLKAAQARDWARQGFQGEVAIDGKSIHYQLDGPADVIRDIKAVKAIFHRPVGDKHDFVLTLAGSGDEGFRAVHDFPSGPWIVDLAAISGDRTVFHQAVRVIVQEPKQ